MAQDPLDRPGLDRPGIDRRGEDAAAAHVTARGARVVARNWRGAGAELDLVFEDGATLVFGEVKTRTSEAVGGAVGAITHAKIKRVARAALAYLQEHDLLDKASCRFDVFAVLEDEHGVLAVEWIQAAFESPFSG